jgi:hypothetical protein
MRSQEYDRSDSALLVIFYAGSMPHFTPCSDRSAMARSGRPASFPFHRALRKRALETLLQQAEFIIRLRPVPANRPPSGEIATLTAILEEPLTFTSSYPAS